MTDSNQYPQSGPHGQYRNAEATKANAGMNHLPCARRRTDTRLIATRLTGRPGRLGSPPRTGRIQARGPCHVAEHGGPFWLQRSSGADPGQPASDGCASTEV
jgi:hypothetical protein